MVSARVLTVMIGWLVLGSLAWAAALPEPQGPPLLIVGGRISQFNGDGVVRFDRAMLDSLPQHAMTTTTPWTEGRQRFEGPLLADLLAAVGSQGQELLLRALNDYFAVVDLEEVAGYPLLLAMRVNGSTLSVRDKGPIWLLYPMSEFPELDTPYHRADMVWQLARIEVR